MVSNGLSSASTVGADSKQSNKIFYVDHDSSTYVINLAPIRRSFAQTACCNAETSFISEDGTYEQRQPNEDGLVDDPVFEVGTPGRTNQLHDSISNCNWEKVRSKMTHRREVHEQTEDSQTALSLACINNAPEDIILYLLSKTPRSAIIIDREGSLPIHHYCTHASPVNSKVLMKLVNLEPRSVSKTNDLMKTPFSLAAEFGKRVEVLETLFQSDHSVASISDIDGSFPLHHCGRAEYLENNFLHKLMTIYPEALMQQNARGETPLILAVSLNASVPVLQEMLYRYPRAARISDSGGFYPVSLLWNSWVNVRKGATGQPVLSDDEAEVTEIVKRNRIQMKSVTGKGDLEGDLAIWWHKMEMLLRVSYHKTLRDALPNGKQWRVVHAAAGCDGCPPGVLHFAMKIEAGQCEEADEEGNLPLHVAAGAPAYIRQNFEKTYGSRIEMLVKKYPEASRKKNVKGELCLHIALRSGKTWDSGIKKILKAEPRGIKIKDTATGLFPFMLAAIGNKNPSSDEGRAQAEARARSKFNKSEWILMTEADQNKEIKAILHNDQLMTLDTVFRLLLAAPSQLKGGIPKENAESMHLLNDNRILREKLRELSTEVHSMRRKEIDGGVGAERRVRFLDEDHESEQEQEQEEELEQNMQEVEAYLIQDMKSKKKEKGKKIEKFKKFYMKRSKRFKNFLRFGKYKK